MNSHCMHLILILLSSKQPAGPPAARRCTCVELVVDATPDYTTRTLTSACVCSLKPSIRILKQKFLIARSSHFVIISQCNINFNKRLLLCKDRVLYRIFSQGGENDRW